MGSERYYSIAHEKVAEEGAGNPGALGPIRRLSTSAGMMSFLTYTPDGPRRPRPLRWLKGHLKTPPLSPAARREAGFLLRMLQEGFTLAMPHSRPLPSLGPRCHELRIRDAGGSWRVIYRIDDDAIVIAEVFRKTTMAIPAHVLRTCRQRFADLDGGGS